MADEILNKKLALDIDGDKKPDIKIDIKSIAIVIGFVISGTMGYNNLKQEIEIAKQLPEATVISVNKGEVKQRMDFLQKEIDVLQEQVKDLEKKVYRK